MEVKAEKKNVKIKNAGYDNYLKKVLPRSEPIVSLIFAFLVGGLICLIGQVILDLLYRFVPDLTYKNAGDITVSFLIFLGSFLTAIGVYDDIGKFAGAGSIVPITGFANSMVSPAIEFKTEGWVYGVQSKMFVIAGPILVSGIVAACIVGVIYFII